jgi:hypothetical protein
MNKLIPIITIIQGLPAAGFVRTRRLHEAGRKVSRGFTRTSDVTRETSAGNGARQHGQ